MSRRPDRHECTHHRSVWPWAALAVPAVLGAGYLGIGAVIASQLTVPKRQFYPEAAEGLGVPYEDVRFPARCDGVEIAGWYAPHAGAGRAIIIVHGKDQSRATEFFDTFPTGRFTEMAGKIHAAGFAVLMIDLRGHGQSGPARFTFGRVERRDIMGAADWLRSRGYRPGSIGVLGISLGAASAVGAAADDSDIGAIAIDSCFAELAPLLRANWQTQAGLPLLLLPSTMLMVRLLYGLDMRNATPAADISRIAPRPVLIIHTRRDQAIDFCHAERLLAALPSAELWVASGPEHARNYNAEPAEYVRRVTDFFDKNLTR